MTRALIIVDIQNDYFPAGANPLEGSEAAADRARELLDAFRATGEPVVHMQHVWDAPDAEFMVPGTSGVEINDRVLPAGDESVFTKAFPNSFLQTPLLDHLHDQGVEQLVICGMMTSMCVDATVRAAADLGFEASVAHDACATMPLEFEGRSIPAADVHGAFLAALGDGYATVASTAELLADRPSVD